MESLADFSMFSIKERRNVLFNDSLTTFCLWLYGVRYIVKDNLDSKRGNPLPWWQQDSFLTIRMVLNHGLTPYNRK